MRKEGEGQQGTEVKYRSSKSAKDRLSVTETKEILYGPTANRRDLTEIRAKRQGQISIIPIQPTQQYPAHRERKEGGLMELSQ